MFRQMTEKLWKQFSKERSTEDIRIPEKVLMECNELVLKGDTMEEVQRLPGENDVSKNSFLRLIFKQLLLHLDWNGCMENQTSDARVS